MMVTIELATNCGANQWVNEANSSWGKVHTERDRLLRRALEDEWTFINSHHRAVRFIKEENIVWDKT